MTYDVEVYEYDDPSPGPSRTDLVTTSRRRAIDRYHELTRRDEVARVIDRTGRPVVG